MTTCSGSLFFRDEKDCKEASDGKQGSEEPFRADGHLCGEKLGQRAENEAEDDEISRGGVLFHGALNEPRCEQDTARRTDDEGSEGDECYDVECVNGSGQLFVDTENEEHLGDADAGQNERDGDDDAAEELNEDTADDGKEARAADLKNAFGNEADEQSANDADDGVNENGSADLADLGFAEDHGSRARHRAEEEIARGNGEVGERKRDELGEKEKTDRRADEKFGKEKEAFLEFVLFEDPVDCTDEAVVNAEDHRHRAARNAGNGHRAADPRTASRREKGILHIFFFHV